jgi:hypothetical protein
LAPIDPLADRVAKAQNSNMITVIIKDALDREIETKRLELTKSRVRTTELEVELRALERAAALRPPRSSQRTISPPKDQRRSGRGGRVPGAISKPWRAILMKVHELYPDGASPDDIAAFGPAFGLRNLRARDARQQADKYVVHGFMEPAGDRYKVTALAAERFQKSSVAPDRGDPVERQASLEGRSNGHIAEGLSV